MKFIYTKLFQKNDSNQLQFNYLLFFEFFEISNLPVRADRIAILIDATDCSSPVFGSFPNLDFSEESLLHDLDDQLVHIFLKLKLSTVLTKLHQSYHLAI